MPKSEWHAQGKYEYFAVNELWPDVDTGIHNSINFPTRKLAQQVANALNDAFAKGEAYAKENLPNG